MRYSEFNPWYRKKKKKKIGLGFYFFFKNIEPTKED
jgi:hypothetical protein